MHIGSTRATQKLPTNIHSIAIFRALQLGDLLVAVPALRAIRAAFPQAHIRLIGLQWSQEFVRRYAHLVDGLITFPGFPGLPEQSWEAKKTLSFLKRLATRKIDLLIQLHGNGQIVNPLLALTSPGNFAGYVRENDSYVPSPFFMEYPAKDNEIRRHLKLMTFLGIPVKGEQLEFPLLARDYDEWRELRVPFAHHQYVVIHPGARDTQRRWDVAGFGEVAQLCQDSGWGVVITGTEDEYDLGNALVARLTMPVVNLIGETTLGSLGVVIHQARLVVTNDTSVSHLATALERPSVVITRAQEPNRWRPLNQRLHTTIDGFSPDAVRMALEAVRQKLDHSEMLSGL